jgi:hypothetical protein
MIYCMVMAGCRVFQGGHEDIWQVIDLADQNLPHLEPPAYLAIIRRLCHLH